MFIWDRLSKFVEKPDGELRLCHNLIALDDTVVNEKNYMKFNNEISRDSYGS